jgi:hypothetical protein
VEQRLLAPATLRPGAVDDPPEGVGEIEARTQGHRPVCGGPESGVEGARRLAGVGMGSLWRRRWDPDPERRRRRCRRLRTEMARRRCEEDEETAVAVFFAGAAKRLG